MTQQEERYFDQIKEGDKQAFELFFKLYYARLCHYAFSFLKEEAGSEEIVQEVFLKLWEKREDLNISTSEKNYLYSAVRNACLNQIKHIEIRENYKNHNEKQIAYSENQNTNPAEQNELINRINQALNQLPEQRQAIFRMSREDGLKYKEIAEKLNISVKTVEAQMGKALKFMREQLEEYLVMLMVISILWY